MIGNLDVTGDIFLTRGHIGEYRGQQVVRTHALNLRRHFLSTLKTQKRERAVSVPTPARAEDRRSQGGLLEDRLNGFGIQEMKNVSERKTVLLRQRNVQAIVGGRSLELKIEAAAETLAQGQSPGLVDAGAERSVDDQLHAAAFIEETLGNDGALGKNITQHGAAFEDVLNGLLDGGLLEAGFLLKPRYRLFQGASLFLWR